MSDGGISTALAKLKSDNNKILEKTTIPVALTNALAKLNAEIAEKTEKTESQPEAKEKTDLDLLLEKIKPTKWGKKRTFSSIDISADKWFLTLDKDAFQKLAVPPSLADGIGLKEEKELRLLGCEMIQSGAILLRLPQTAAATGQILYQRYYYQKSFVKFNFIHTVMACLLLASRIEEAPRRPRDVINVVNRLKQLLQDKNRDRKRLVHIKLDKNYVELKNCVIKTERRLLNALGFVVHVHHPHKIIMSYCHILGLTDRRDILIKAWNYMNDGLRTDIFLRYKAETIACACLWLAARTVDDPVRLPSEPRPWYELYDCTKDEIEQISLILLNLYNNQKIPSFGRLSAHVEKLYKANKKPDSQDKPPTITVSEDKSKKEEKRDRDRSKRSSSRSRSDRDRKDRKRGRSRERSRSPRKEKRDRKDRENRDSRDRRKDRDNTPPSKGYDKRRDRRDDRGRRRRSKSPRDRR
ncbi:unnamed protein product [Bursaphelenchus okinawaensis]|uniref:Cyclin-like domain-containing protein n=1 Tax=Bursaphelenchus okinawaensis TaxID=465554 RepID=A0A811L6M3_9BILA|nr:unnamed protein product [Bursaphelenchus okinawaensis]CAG9117629.1 unnamed protein product [Bursaphelenchus okinawaensis]